MASVSVVPTLGTKEPTENSAGVDRLPEEMNDMKIRDDKVSGSNIYLFVCTLQNLAIVALVLYYYVFK